MSTGHVPWQRSTSEGEPPRPALDGCPLGSSSLTSLPPLRGPRCDSLPRSRRPPAQPPPPPPPPAQPPDRPAQPPPAAAADGSVGHAASLASPSAAAAPRGEGDAPQPPAGRQPPVAGGAGRNLARLIGEIAAELPRGLGDAPAPPGAPPPPSERGGFGPDAPRGSALSARGLGPARPCAPPMPLSARDLAMSRRASGADADPPTPWWTPGLPRARGAARRPGGVVRALSTGAGAPALLRSTTGAWRRARLTTLRGLEVEQREPTADHPSCSPASLFGSPRGELQPRVRAAQSEGVALGLLTGAREEVVVLRKYSPFDRLGADVVRHEQRGWMIQSVEGAGMIARWNLDNPSTRVRPGDVIVEVNGVRGDTKAMLDQLQSMIMRIVIERPRAPARTTRSSTTGCSQWLGESRTEEEGGYVKGQMTEQDKAEPTSITRLAEAFVKQCGSLDRAFSAIDYNKAQKFSVGQWNTGLVNAHISCQGLSGMKANQVFKMMAAHSADDRFYVSREAWTEFWFAEIQDTDHNELLSVDLGEHGGRQTRGLVAEKSRFALAVARFKSLRRRRSSEGEGQLEGDEVDEVDEVEDAAECGAVDAGAYGRVASYDTTTTAASSSSDSEEEGEEGEDHELAVRRAELRAAVEQAEMSGAGPAEWSGEASDELAGRSRASGAGPPGPGSGAELLTAAPGTAPATDALRRLLAGEGTEADLAGLDQRERRVLVQHQLLQEEIRELGVEGIEAVAHVLMAKLGSYKRRAFSYFDVANQRSFPMMAWDLGMVMLRIDMEAIVGMSALRVFQQINTDGSNAVSWKEWKAFFKNVSLEAHEKMTAMNRVNIEVRATMQEDTLLKKVKEQVHRRSKALKKTSSKGIAEDRDVGGKATSPKTCGADEKCGVEEECSADEDANANANHASRPLSDQRESDAVSQRLFDELFLLQDNEGKEYAALTHEEVREAQSVCQTLGFTICQNGDDGPVSVYNYRTFTQETRKQLRALKQEHFLEFPTELTDAQRGIVHRIAKELGLASYDRGRGEEKRVAVANDRGFSERIQREFAAIEPGGSQLYTEKFSPCQRHIIQAVADSLDLWVRSSQGSLEVFNLDDFGKGVRKDLMALADGEEMTFQPDLTDQQRNVVFAIAEDLGLLAVDTGSDDSRQIAVGNMTTFLEDVKAELQRLKTGEMYAFDESLTHVRNRAVHVVAAQMGVYSETMQENGDTWVEVHRLYPGQRAPYRQPPPLQLGAADGHADAQLPATTGPPGASAPARPRRGSAAGGADAATAGAGPAGRRRSSAWADEPAAGRRRSSAWADDGEESIMQSLFDILATGSFQGQKIFLRFPDLKELVSKIQGGSTCANTFQKYHEELEAVFNDTMQLQIDMDIRCNKGLTFRWFQVFIQTSMRKIGKDALALLFTLSQKREA